MEEVKMTVFWGHGRHFYRKSRNRSYFEALMIHFMVFNWILYPDPNEKLENVWRALSDTFLQIPKLTNCVKVSNSETPLIGPPKWKAKWPGSKKKVEIFHFPAFHFPKTSKWIGPYKVLRGWFTQRSCNVL